MGRLAGLCSIVALAIGLGWFVAWSPAESAGAAAPPEPARDTAPATPAVQLATPKTADPASPVPPVSPPDGEIRADSPARSVSGEPEEDAVSTREPALPERASGSTSPAEQEVAHQVARARLIVHVVDLATGKSLHDSQGSLVQSPSMPAELSSPPKAADANGRLRFERMAPGAYYLTIMRGLVMVQREVELIAGQAHDLGTIALDNGPGTLIRVVDKEGQPVPCLVEIAVWESAGREGPLTDVEALYSRGTSHLTDERGTYLMPLPIRASLVRARPAPSAENGFAALPVWTPNRPASRDSRTAEIKLVTRDLIETSFTFDPYAPWSEGDRLDVTSHTFNLSYFRGPPPSEPLQLLTGHYRFEHWAGDELLSTTEHLPIPSTPGMTSCTIRLP